MLNIQFSNLAKKAQTNSPYFAPAFLKDRLEDFKKTINDPKIGFFHINKKSEILEQTQIVYKKFAHKTQFVHIGIGGSGLGPEMLISALPYNNNREFFFISNIDSDEIFLQLKKINPSSAVFYLVSKSGTTAEPMAALALICSWLKEKGIKEQDFNKYFVFCTDPEKGDVRKLGNTLNISMLEVPSNVGGRFCVLTSVGYFPALFAGINIEQLQKSAHQFSQTFLEDNVDKNILLQTASTLMALKDNGVDQTVLFPYSSLWRNLSFWFVQLWAESLGKKVNLKNEVVNVGFTPVPGYGATDQHSQVQLFMEGPFNKCLMTVEIKKRNHDFSLKNSFDLNNLQKLSGHTLNQLMEAEMQGTLMALEQNQRPFIHFVAEENNEESIASLIIFFECLTALMGSYLKIDPFDQPGVEAGKIFAFERLAKNSRI
jgi:glucose-6-phosphate isomerase